ncbi:MAG: GntR family transcriptional regulator [Actinobacteria bacterium]|nr:GntR family transcriptional regulator [Actinomycetota bacterium]
MLLAPSEGGGALGDQVARRLGRAVRLGLLIDGDRLPSEAELAAQMGVSTVTLREALSTLREQGLVVTRRGRGGGTFVRAPADSRAPLRQFGVHELQELGDQRAAVRGTAARLAAERALDEEIERLEDQLKRLEAASTASERRRADTQLTIAIAGAAQSSRLTREEARLRAEVGDLLGLELSEAEYSEIVGERRRLVEAIRRRRPEKARELAEAQVAAETARLVTLRFQLAETDDVDGPKTPATLEFSAHQPEVLGEVRADVEMIFGELAGLAAAFMELRGGGALAVDDLAELRPAIFSTLEAGTGLISGAGAVVAPGLLTDRDRWLEWWSVADERARPEALRVNLDPQAPDFYDYTSADWFATPRATLAPHLAGPFVDYACTNTYALTLSTPILRDREFLGVAAADVLVASLERHIVPRLATLGRPVALATATGRVIASNAPEVVAGQRLPPPSGAPPAKAADPVATLRLVEL